MATLEKIRSKSVLLVSIIFVALFLFIITIIDNPLGLFMDQTTVVNVDGEKIGYEQYQQKSQELREQNPQNEQADEQALQTLISETLFQREFSKLGLAVTPNEISEIIVGENAPAYIVNSFISQFGAAPQDILSAIQNPEAVGLTSEQAATLSDAYKKFEDQIEQFLLGQKFFMLAGGTVNANKLDAKAAYDEANTSYTLATVSKSIYAVQDSVSEAEIEKYYKEHRNEFKVNEPSRYVRYVSLDITPSPADRQAASAAVNEAMQKLSETQGMDALTGDSRFIINRASGDSASVAAAKINGLNRFVSEAEVGEARVILNNVYSPANPRIIIARLTGRENKVNGAKVRRAIINPSANPDSVLVKLNAAGSNPDSIEGIEQTTLLTYDFSQLPSQQVDSVRNAGGKYVLFEMGNGYTVADAIESLDAPKNIYTYATATYDVEPSRETIDQLNTRMRDFLIVASTAEAFNQDNAAQQGLSVNDALVSNSSTAINNLSDSRNIVAWAMDAKKGEVSRLYTDSKNTHLAAAAVVDIYKDDFVPASFPPVHQQVENEALTQKKADKLIAEYTGKGTTLADYQAAMEAQRIDTISHVNVGSARYAQLGGLRAHKPGDVVGPLRWNGSVIVYNVIDAEDGKMPYDETANSTQYQRQMQQFLFSNDRITNVLLGDGKIKNRMLKFTRQ